MNAKSRFINVYNNFEEETALMIAIKNNNIEIVKILIERPDININPQPNKFRDGDTALNIAIRNHNIEIIKLLLSKPNIGINSQTIYHKTNEHSVSSLYLAIKQNNLEIIQLLLSYPNIDVNCFTVNIENWNRLKIHKEKAPIHLAAEKNNIEMMKLLLSHPKIDINAKSYCYYPTTSCWQNTALRIAIENKNLNMIKLLLENPRTNVNIKSSYGYIHNKIIDISNVHSSINQYEYTEFKTPLFDAVEYGNVEITQLLMKKQTLIFTANLILSRKEPILHIKILMVSYIICARKKYQFLILLTHVTLK